MKKQLITLGALVGGFVIGASALIAVAQTAGTWSAPTAAPTDGNTPAPINVGSVWQYKLGNNSNGTLSLGTSTPVTCKNGACQPTLDVVGGALIDSLGITNKLIYTPAGAAVATGSVMVAKDNIGTVGWVATSSLGIKGGSTPILPTIGNSQYTVEDGTSVLSTSDQAITLPVANELYNIVINASFYTCTEYQTDLYFDNTIITTDYNNVGDLAGCDTITLYGIANNIVGTNHTVRLQRTSSTDNHSERGIGDSQFMWTAYPTGYYIKS
jgi:hypothetical protein